MSRPLVLVPLDDRPCCWQFPARLAAMAGHRLVQPPREMLGNYLQPGDPDAILAWLDGARGNAIVSLDMLCWGGLVASRRLDLPLEPALVRLARAAAQRPAYAFSVIMRTAPTQTNVEEVERATRVTELALWMARAEAGRPGAEERVRTLRQSIPAGWVEEYLQARQRNHAVNLAAVGHAAHGDFRFLLLGVDDSRTEGLNVRESQRLEAAAAQLSAPAVVAPGTDETAMLLLVRALAAGTPLTVRWSREADRTRVGRYEDRDLQGVVEAQARAAGVPLRDGERRQLWVYGPYAEQTEASVQGRRRSPRAAAFVQDLARELARGAHIAVADVARANGADLALARELLASGVAHRLAGYAAWNTAGNTLGTALAAAALVADRPIPATERARLAFLLERFADDYVYEAELRQQVSAPFGGSFVRLEGERLREARRQVRDRMVARIQRLARQIPVRLSSIAVDLPWPRTFEVEVDVTVRVD